MDTIKNTSYGVFSGIFDSIKGIAFVFYIDSQINRLNDLKNIEKSTMSDFVMNPERLSSSSSTISTTADERRIGSKAPAGARNIQKGELKIAMKVFKCCALNGGFTWLSIILFENLVLPGLKLILTWFYGSKSDELHYVWGWLQSLLSILFGMMWVLPIFLLSKVVSSLWFQDIANAAYKFRKGRPQMIPNISKLIADFLFSLLVQFLFLLQSMLVNLLPFNYFGRVLCFVHLCLLYSLYSFEYKWFNMGWELHKRLSYIECNWPYFLGFGVPLTILTNLSNSVIVSSCIFSIFFPLFILSANEALPVVGASDIPLRLFSPVVAVSNLFFNRSVGVRKPITASPPYNNTRTTPPSTNTTPERRPASGSGSISSRHTYASANSRRLR